MQFRRNELSSSTCRSKLTNMQFLYANLRQILAKPILPMQVLCKSYANPTKCDANLIQVLCKSCANAMQILCKAHYKW